jgi:hypothetical protein
VQATIYYQHPSGERGRFERVETYEPDEKEYELLQTAFFAFERGETKKRTYALRLNSREEITLRFDKIWAILHRPRVLVID